MEHIGPKVTQSLSKVEFAIQSYHPKKGVNYMRQMPFWEDMNTKIKHLFGYEFAIVIV